MGLVDDVGAVPELARPARQHSVDALPGAIPEEWYLSWKTWSSDVPLYAESQPGQKLDF